MTNKCIPISVVREVFFKLKKPIVAEYEKHARTDIWDISDAEVADMVESLSSKALIDAKKVTDSRVIRKLDNSLSIPKKFKDTLAKRLVNTLKTSKSGFSKEKSLRYQAVALKTVVDTVQGELNKPDKYNFDLQEITNEQGIPFIPLSRISAVIGRKIMYMTGHRFSREGDPNFDPVDVEHMYYLAGMEALKDLEANGFITLHTGDDLPSTAKDYLDDIDSKPNFTKPVTDTVPALGLNAKALGAKSVLPASKDKIVNHFRGKHILEGSELAESELGVITQILDAVSSVSTAEHVVFPSNRENVLPVQKNDDRYSLSKTLNKVKQEIESKPLFFQPAMFDFFQTLFDEVKNVSESASSRIRKQIPSNSMLERLFKLETDEAIESDIESRTGRTLAKTTPIDDLIEYFDHFSKDKKALPILMAFFGGANSRLNLDNTLVNYHSSKFMRNSLAVKEYSIDAKTDAFKFFVAKVANEFDTDGDMIKMLLNQSIDTDMDSAIKAYDQFVSANNLTLKLNAATKMSKSFPHLDLAQLVSLIGAAKDIRSALNTGTLTTTYPVTSDVTASGAQLILLEALGTNPEGISDILQQLGIFKGNEGQEFLNDVYQILQNKLDLFINDKEDPDAAYRPEEVEDGRGEYLKEVIEGIQTHLYKGKLRNLSKGPTMTHLYDQSLGGAKDSLSKEFTDLTLKILQKGKVPNDFKKLLVKIVPELEGLTLETVKKDPELKKKLVAGFKNSGVPEFLYNKLEDALVTKYLKKYKNRSTEIFQLISSDPGLVKMKVLPVTAIMDGIEHTKENIKKYGVPLSKIFEVSHDIDGDTVLTREQKLQQTVMNVSMIHSKDTANMYLSLEGLANKYDSGIMVVHDQHGSRPDLIMEADKNHIKMNKDVAMSYDIHEQVLLAAAAYNPSLKSNDKYNTLLQEVKDTVEVKRKAIEDSQNGYDLETGNLIGDKIDFSEINPEFDETDSSSVEDLLTERPKEQGKEKLETFKLRSKLREYSKESDLIREYLESEHSAALDKGTQDSFDPETDTIKISEESSRIAIEHEIVHSFTTAMVNEWGKGNRKDIDLDYINKSLEHLRKSNKKFSGQVDYILKLPNTIAVAELISVLATDKDAATEVYSSLGASQKTLKKIIDKLVAKVRRIIKGPTEADLEAPVDPELLSIAISNAVVAGKRQRAKNVDSLKVQQKDFETLYFWEAERVLNESVERYVTDPAINKGIGLASGLHTLLANNLPLYDRTAKAISRIYDDSATLQGIVHKIANNGVNKLKKNDVLSVAQEANARKNETVSQQLKKFSQITRKMSEEDKKAFYAFSSRMSMADYWVFADGVTNIDKELELLESSGHLDEASLKKLQTIVDFNVHEIVKANTKYNVYEAGFNYKDSAQYARRWVALKSIKEIGIDKFEKLNENKELMQLWRDNALANAALVSGTSTINNRNMRDNGLSDEYKDPVIFKVVTKEQLKNYQGPKSSWEVIRYPTDKKLGVIYQKVIDSTDSQGVFLDLKLQSSDLDVEQHYSKYQGVMKVNGKYKLSLTQEEKESAGLITNAEQSIVRSMAYNMAINDTNIIRDKVLEEDTYYNIARGGEEELIKRIEADNQETPWLLKGVDSLPYDKLDARIKAKYMPLPKEASDVDRFNEKVDYVRKDMAYWLTGDREKSLVGDDRKLQWMLRITKNLISGAKIKMIALNPTKIGMDNMFNLTYLAILGVDPLHVVREYRNVAREYHEYNELKDKLNALRIKSLADNDKYGKEMKHLEKKMAEHPARGLVDRGFINSLGSSLVMQSDDPSSGFKTDIDKVLRKLLVDQKGKNNAVGNFIMKAANAGWGIENLLEVWSPTFGAVRSGKGIEAEFNRMAEELRDIKTEEDVVAYMHQYLNSPNSEFVKLGSYMTDLTDVLAKETYYRHLIKQGMDAKKAEIQVIERFPDYKEGLPVKVKQWDSIGVVMFPQYWLQMISRSYHAIKEKPVNFGVNTAIANYFDSSLSLFDETIIGKATSRWGLVHNPTSHIGWGSIFPF